MKFFYVAKLWCSMFLFCLVVACAPLQPSLTATSLPTSVAQPTSIVGSPTQADKGNRMITLDQEDQTIILHVGETFLLNLGGDTYQWEVTLTNPAVVSRVVNVAVIKGAQGIYTAHQTGQTTLTANGDPLCRQAKPACGMPSKLFTIEIEVIA